VSTAVSASGRLADCLAQIRALMEGGDVIAAAALVDELNGIAACPPEPMTETELMEIRETLSRCGELERSLRQSALQALQRLGATRRSQAYRQP